MGEYKISQNQPNVIDPVVFRRPSNHDLRSLWNPDFPPFDPIIDLKDLAFITCPYYSYYKNLIGLDPFNRNQCFVQPSSGNRYLSFGRDLTEFHRVIIETLKNLVWNERVQDLANQDPEESERVFGRLMSSYKLNYDMKIETMSETKSEVDGKKVVDQLFRGSRFFRFIRWILRRGTPNKITESKSEKSFLHFKIKDLALNFSPENSDLSQGYLAWIGSGGVEYAEVPEIDLPGDDNKIRETLQGLDEIPPGHPMAEFTKGLSTRLQEKPINAIFMLKIKCENESIKELVFELSYDVPEYIFAYQFTLWHAVFPEIETNLSAEVVRTKEIAKEITKDTKDFQSDSDTVHLVTTLPLITGFTSKLDTRIKEFLDLLKGKHVIITYKNLNIVNANDKLADGFYRKEFSTPIKVRLFGGKAKSTGTHKTTGEIILEIRPKEIPCEIILEPDMITFKEYVPCHGNFDAFIFAMAPGGGSNYNWTFIQGTERANFLGSTTNREVSIRLFAPSIDPDDVTIRVSYLDTDGQLKQCAKSFSILQPRSLKKIIDNNLPLTEIDGIWYIGVERRYQVLDQFDQPLRNHRLNVTETLTGFDVEANEVSWNSGTRDLSFNPGMISMVGPGVAKVKMKAVSTTTDLEGHFDDTPQIWSSSLFPDETDLIVFQKIQVEGCIVRNNTIHFLNDSADIAP